MRHLLLTSLAAIAFAGCAADAADPAAGASEAAAISPAAVTAPTLHGSLVNAAFWRDPANGELYVVGAAGIAGLELYRPDGTRAAKLDSLEAGLVATVPGVRLGDETVDVIVAYDATEALLRAYAFDAGQASFRPVLAQPLDVADEVTGLCHYKSRLSGSDYLYAVTDAGLIRHYELYPVPGGIAGRLLRTIPSAKGSGYCAVDPRDGWLYVSEESNGVWRIGAEAEADTTREAVDLREPFGGLSDEIKGVAVQAAGADLSYLFVADLGQRTYRRVRAPEGDRLRLSRSRACPKRRASRCRCRRRRVARDRRRGPCRRRLRHQTVRPRRAGHGMGLPFAAAPAAPDAPKVVRPASKRKSSPPGATSADDPAIWVHPEDAAQSLVIGTGKKSGLYVFDLEGRTLQVLEDGRMNNVDVRDGFPLGGETVPIVAASNRSNDGIALYRIDPDTRQLIDVADGVLTTGFGDPYGLCLYRSRATGRITCSSTTAAMATCASGGWPTTQGPGRRGTGARVRGGLAGRRLRRRRPARDAVCCRGGRRPVEVLGRTRRRRSRERDRRDRRCGPADRRRRGRRALFDGGDGGGYLVVSNQGENDYAVYRREGDNEFVGFFHIVANAAAGIDGASETDGLDVSSAALGAAFPAGCWSCRTGATSRPKNGRTSSTCPGRRSRPR